MLKIVLVASALVLPAIAAGNNLTPIQGTKHDHDLVVKSDTGDSTITAREMLVDVTYTDGRPRKGALVVHFDSSSGRYLWEFGLVSMTDTASTVTTFYGTTAYIYKASDRLIIFGWYRTPLVIHESTTKANNIDEAEAKSLSEAIIRLPAKLLHSTDDRVVIDTAKLLPHEFIMACELCSGPAKMKLLDVAHKGNTWEITIQGQWKEKITLDEKYAVTATARVD
jgi:hypothetical protein